MPNTTRVGIPFISFTHLSSTSSSIVFSIVIICSALINIEEVRECAHVFNITHLQTTRALIRAERQTGNMQDQRDENGERIKAFEEEM